jgi:two-component system sensor histidine kinase RpfC
MEKIESNPTVSHANPITWIAGRLKGREDSEHEQALVRIFISLAILTYVLTAENLDSKIWIFDVSTAVYCFLFFSFGILVSIVHKPAQSVPRRLVALCADTAMTTLFLAITGEHGAPWWPVYLWMIFGYGFRFGELYLYLSAAISFIGFSLILFTNDYWMGHTGLGVGLLAALIVLPGYVATLLRRLTEAQRRTEEANRAKSDFLARMSHEIRTPLNGVIGTSELLRSSDLGAEEMEYADTIFTSAHTLLHLIEDILDLSKIEAGKLTLEHTEFDLHNLLHSSVRMFADRAKAKQLQLTCQIGLDTPYKLLGDPFHMRQILNNLISNALKFTEKGSIEVRCDMIRGDQDKALVRFEVVDTGIGIPEDAQQRIFDNFSQADESTTRRFGGTGLGTAITKQLVELMGGRIGLRSTPNIGTTFWFDIEFERQPKSEEVLDTKILKECKVLRLCRKRDTQTSITRCIRGWGVSYRDVTSPREAKQLLQEATSHNSPFEVLLVDGITLDAATRLFLESIGRDMFLSRVTILVAPPAGETAPSLDTSPNMAYTLTAPLDKALLFNALHASHASSFEDEDVISLSDHFTKARQAQRKLRILVAEDNSVNRMVIGRILGRAGHTHHLVENGQELLDALEEAEYDLVIVDMQMPVLGGIDAFKIYSFAHAGEERPPFVMLTANATLDARKECKEAGIKHFLTKPISSVKLLETIHKVSPEVPDLEPAVVDEVPPPMISEEAEDELPTVDRRVLNDVIELAQNSEFLYKLQENLEREGVQLLQGMAESLDCGDYTHFQDLAHALKGSAANLGLRKLADLASQAQHLPHAGFLREGEASLDEIRQEFTKAKAALSEEIGLRKPASR